MTYFPEREYHFIFITHSLPIKMPVDMEYVLKPIHQLQFFSSDPFFVSPFLEHIFIMEDQDGTQNHLCRFLVMQFPFNVSMILRYRFMSFVTPPQNKTIRLTPLYFFRNNTSVIWMFRRIHYQYSSFKLCSTKKLSVYKVIICSVNKEFANTCTFLMLWAQLTVSERGYLKFCMVKTKT